MKKFPNMISTIMTNIETTENTIFKSNFIISFAVLLSKLMLQIIKIAPCAYLTGSYSN